LRNRDENAKSFRLTRLAKVFSAEPSRKGTGDVLINMPRAYIIPIPEDLFKKKKQQNFKGGCMGATFDTDTEIQYF
jgi:hypothetical protein